MALEEYKYEKSIGSGSFGDVELVSSLNTGKFYARKGLTNRGAWKKEVAILKAIVSGCSEHMLCLHHTYAEGGVGYIVTNYFVGYDLGQYLKRVTYDERDALARVVYDQMMSALRVLEGLRLAHRDIKPANIMYNHATGQCHLIDFGLAVWVDDPDIKVGGSSAYLSKAVVEHLTEGKPLTPVALLSGDVYTLGVVVYEVLTNRRPYRVMVLDPRYRPLPDFSIPIIPPTDPWWRAVLTLMLTGDYTASDLASQGL